MRDGLISLRMAPYCDMARVQFATKSNVIRCCGIEIIFRPGIHSSSSGSSVPPASIARNPRRFITQF